MAITTYAELKTAIQDWLINESLTGSVSHVGTVIALAEAEINKRLATAEPAPPRPTETVENATTLDGEYESQPAGMIRPKTLEITGLTRQWRLKYVDDDALAQMKEREAEYRSARASETGTTNVPPEYYTMVGSQFRFFPVPQTSFNLVVTHYKKPDALSDSNTSNWILASHPDVYLWASLVAAATFIEDEERVAKWVPLFENAVERMLQSYPAPRNHAPLRSDIPFDNLYYRRTVVL